MPCESLRALKWGTCLFPTLSDSFPRFPTPTLWPTHPKHGDPTVCGRARHKRLALSHLSGFWPAKVIKSATRNMTKVQGTGHDQLHIYTCRWIHSFTCRVNWKIEQTWQNDAVNSCTYYPVLHIQALLSSTPCKSAKGAAWLQRIHESEFAVCLLPNAHSQPIVGKQFLTRCNLMWVHANLIEFVLSVFCTHSSTFSHCPGVALSELAHLPGWNVENQAARH